MRESELCRSHERVLAFTVTRVVTEAFSKFLMNINLLVTLFNLVKY